MHSLVYAICQLAKLSQKKNSQQQCDITLRPNLPAPLQDLNGTLMDETFIKQENIFI